MSDPAELPGLAHFCEHMVFLGTEKVIKYYMTVFNCLKSNLSLIKTSIREARWPHGSALDSGSSGPISRPGRGHCIVFMGKTRDSHSASLHPGV